MARFCFSPRGSVGALALAAAVFGGSSFAGVALATSAPAYSQDQPAGGAPPAATRGRMAKILMSLDLSDAQKSQIRAIRDETMKANANVTDRDQRRANYAVMRAKVEAVLTPAQRSQFKAKMEAMRQQVQTPHS